jgi:hypothetical protein
MHVRLNPLSGFETVTPQRECCVQRRHSSETISHRTHQHTSWLQNCTSSQVLPLCSQFTPHHSPHLPFQLLPLKSTKPTTSANRAQLSPSPIHVMGASYKRSNSRSLVGQKCFGRHAAIRPSKRPGRLFQGGRKSCIPVCGQAELGMRSRASSSQLRVNYAKGKGSPRDSEVALRLFWSCQVG